MKKILFFCLLTIASISFAKEEKWLDEAAKVVITKSERETAKNLKTDAERQAFLKEFWAKRDPSPGTPENEHKTEIENRIKEVNTVMKSNKSYENDLGLTLLLLGAPDEHTKPEERGGPVSGDDEEEEAGTQERQVLTYRKLPPGIHEGELKIEFISSGSGWVFADEKKAEEILEQAKQYHLKMTQAAAEKAKQQPAVQKTPSPGAPVAPVAPPAAPEPPLKTPALKTALDAAAGATPPKDVPIQAIADSFMTSEGQVFATVAIDAPQPAPSLVGIRVLAPSGAILKEMEFPFSNPSETAGHFQMPLSLTPGDYSLALAVASGDKTGAIKQDLKIPDYSKLSLSSIILAKKFTQLPEPKPEREPYTFGKIKLQPSIERTFSKTDELMVFYEIYNFQASAAGNPSLEVVYTFQRGKDKPKSSAPKAAEGLVTGKKMTVPTGFPLTTLPSGEYKLTVTITDKANNQTATQETSFTVQ